MLDTRGGSAKVLVRFSGTGGPAGWNGYLDLSSRQPSAWILRLLEESGGLEIVATIGTGSGGTLRGKLVLVTDTGGTTILRDD